MTPYNDQPRDYCILITPEYGAWTASIPDLPGCIAVGQTPEEAIALLEDAKQSWISASLQMNLPIPQPTHPSGS
jgi:predicted RNase H-like HicB family nuclease